MGSSIKDSNLIIISNGEKSYYSCHKGVGQILFELGLGIFTGEKPIASEAFKKLSQSWSGIPKYDAPLPSSEAVYGYLVINFDTKTIVSRSGYSYPNIFHIQWILKSLKSIFKEKSDENVISDESVIYMFNNGYMKIQNRKKKLFDFNMSLKEFYEKTKEHVYDFLYIEDDIPELKELSQIFIELPKDWTLINKEEYLENYDDELKKLIE